MQNLLEKLKSLDKKILIGAGVAFVLVIALIVALFVGLNSEETNKEDDKTKVEQNDDKDKDKEDESEDESEDETEAVFTVKVVDAEGNPVAGVTVQVCKDTCIPGTTDEAGVATFNIEITDGYKLQVLTCPEGYEYTGEAEIALESGKTEYTLTIQKAVVESGDGNTATQQPTTTNPSGEEILGAGSKDQPYLEIPNLDNMTLTTVSIPAGKTLYYGIQRVGGMILTINDANAYVIESNGTRHNASGGKVSFTVENALASDYVMFQIGNKSGTAKSFTIKFSNPTGSKMNPTVVNSTTLNNGCTVTLQGGDSSSEAAVGYYYKYTAERSGTIRFYMTADKTSQMSISNDNPNVTTVKNTELDLVTDEQGNQCIEFEVTQGEQLEIYLVVDKQGRTYPTATITFSGKYK